MQKEIDINLEIENIMKKEIYVKPEIEIISFSYNDVIVASQPQPDEYEW